LDAYNSGNKIYHGCVTVFGFACLMTSGYCDQIAALLFCIPNWWSFMSNFLWLFLGIMDPSLMVTEDAGKADLPFISDLRQMELSPALFT